MPELWVVNAGRLRYADGVALQERVRARRQAGEIPDTLLFVEHDPVYTKGRRSEPGHLPMGEEWYRMQGVEVEETDRGGQVTYHGPGQLVGYPIMGIKDVLAYVRTMERALIAALADEQVEAEIREGLTGVWVEDRKIGSIGVHVARGRHHARIRHQRRQRPPAVRVDRAVRHRERADDVALQGDRANRPDEVLPQARGVAVRGGVRPAPAAGLARAPSWRPGSLSRVSTRSRANPGGARILDMGEVRPFRERKPPWFKVPAPGGAKFRELKSMIDDAGLNTVCEEAACPNIGECWDAGTATFMILGDTCTRRCGFCNVKTGKPTFDDPLEPLRVAQSVRQMGLKHAVITSVDRDDLPDLGSRAFVGVIRSIRRQAPGCKVEVLTPDFRGQEMPLARVIAERPDVFNHNVETVPRLYPLARRGSNFLRSCRVLRNAKEMGGDEVVTKSGLMTGLGETREEMLDAFGVLREHGVQVLTVGPVPAADREPPAGGQVLASG